MKNWPVNFLSWLLCLVGIVYCVSSLIRHYQSIPHISWSMILIIKLLPLILIFYMAILLYFEGWRLIVSYKNNPVSFYKAFALMGLSQIAKYIPGNIFHYASRMSLALKEGIPSGVMAVSMALEMALSTLTVLVIVMFGILSDSSFRTVIRLLSPIGISWWYLCVLGATLFTVVFCMKGDQIRGWLYKFKPYLNSRLIVQAVIIYALIYLITGLTIKLMPWALWNNTISVELSYAVWRVSLCWLAGFIVPGAPAGLGVREALFIRLFSPEFGEGVAACLALVFRLITTFGDFVTFFIAWYVGRRVLNMAEPTTIG